ncbi:hypothetical protein QBC34DRAFT_455462 [Podospora aff. communis PSN243]|uniref:Uncharacterized protein n=1 Tax=Podospora aff. communis PSN243 TaxID=3040156 RepID=A0AAV9GZK4_9PEZI|nr:hypothetical protein QBC34DRAFT_455462 [Podospora aff. communis PSN243]
MSRLRSWVLLALMGLVALVAGQSTSVKEVPALCTVDYYHCPTASTTQGPLITWSVVTATSTANLNPNKNGTETVDASTITTTYTTWYQETTSTLASNTTTHWHTATVIVTVTDTVFTPLWTTLHQNTTLVSQPIGTTVYKSTVTHTNHSCGCHDTPTPYLPRKAAGVSTTTVVMTTAPETSYFTTTTIASYSTISFSGRSGSIATTLSVIRTTCASVVCHPASGPGFTDITSGSSSQAPTIPTPASGSSVPSINTRTTLSASKVTATGSSTQTTLSASQTTSMASNSSQASNATDVSIGPTPSHVSDTSIDSVPNSVPPAQTTLTVFSSSVATVSGTPTTVWITHTFLSQISSLPPTSSANDTYRPSTTVFVSLATVVVSERPTVVPLTYSWMTGSGSSAVYSIVTENVTYSIATIAPPSTSSISSILSSSLTATTAPRPTTLDNGDDTSVTIPWPTSTPPPLTTTAATALTEPTTTSSASSTTGSSYNATFTGFVVPTIAFTLEDVRYTVPSEDEDPLDIILSNGTLAKIEHGWITINDTQMAFPEALPDGGFCSTLDSYLVCFAARFLDAPGDGGGNGGSDPKSECDIPTCAPLDLICIGEALVKSFQCMAKGAAEAVDDIAGLGGVMLGHAFSTSMALAGEVTQEIETDVQAAMNAAERAISRIEQPFEEFEMQEMAVTEAIRTVGPLTGEAADFAIRCTRIRPPNIRQILNLIRNMRSIFKGIFNNAWRGARSKLLQMLADLTLEFLFGSTPGAILAGAGLLSGAVATYGAVAAGSWVLESLKDPSPRLYFVQTDFSPKTFHPFVAFISDGSGEKLAAELDRPSTGPCYFGRLNKWVARVLPAAPYVSYVDMQWNEAEEAAYQDAMGGDGSLLYGPKDSPVATEEATCSQETEDDEPEDALLADLLGEGWNLTLSSSSRQQDDDDSWIIREDDYDHNKLLSWRKGMALDQQGSIWRTSQGEGVTIFMLGSGADIARHWLEFRTKRSKPELSGYVVPNGLTCPDMDPVMCFPETLKDAAECMDSNAVGTHAASLAAGSKYGIARKSTLYFVKMVNQYKVLSEVGAFRVALEHIMGVIRVRSIQGKAVVHIAFDLGGPVAITSDAIARRFKDAWVRFQDFCRENGVIIVMAAGDEGWTRDPAQQVYMGDMVPQRFAGPDSEIIAVGGVYHDGSMIQWQTQPGVTITLPGGGRGGIQPYRGAPCPAEIRAKWHDDGYCFGGVDIFAPAFKLQTIRAYACVIYGAPAFVSGTHFAAAQVPWNPHENNLNFYGRRMKTLLTQLSWERFNTGPSTAGDRFIWPDPRAPGLVGDTPPYALPQDLKVSFAHNDAWTRFDELGCPLGPTELDPQPALLVKRDGSPNGEASQFCACDQCSDTFNNGTPNDRNWDLHVGDPSLLVSDLNDNRRIFRKSRLPNNRVDDDDADTGFLGFDLNRGRGNIAGKSHLPISSARDNIDDKTLLECNLNGAHHIPGKSHIPVHGAHDHVGYVGDYYRDQSADSWHFLVDCGNPFDVVNGHFSFPVFQRFSASGYYVHHVYCLVDSNRSLLPQLQQHVARGSERQEIHSGMRELPADLRAVRGILLRILNMPRFHVYAQGHSIGDQLLASRLLDHHFFKRNILGRRSHATTAPFHFHNPHDTGHDIFQVGRTGDDNFDVAGYIIDQVDRTGDDNFDNIQDIQNNNRGPAHHTVPFMPLNFEPWGYPGCTYHDPVVDPVRITGLKQRGAISCPSSKIEVPCYANDTYTMHQCGEDRYWPFSVCRIDQYH